MNERENGFRLPKCCPCEARLGHLEIDTHGYLVNVFGVYLFIYCHPGMCDNVGHTFTPLFISNFTLFLIKSTGLGIASVTAFVYIQTNTSASEMN